jgi:protease II
VKLPRTEAEEQREQRWRRLVTPEEKAVLERFMERRRELSPEARYRLAERIAASLRAHEPEAWAGKGPEEVLEEVWRLVRGL